ncbi:hypothetical protein ACFOWM_08150 [Ferruginibacter yonginensis]|uniref:Uncharacterized protein n=1 Tax=Ferruginibacter yonginensis TaxID=1310416 RepID=A0ABV8QV84_9BACT
MNVLAYSIYLFITYWVTVKVGNIFYKNGRHYILNIFNNDVPLADFINKILLVGYYLVNLGYATVMLKNWKTIATVAELMASVSNKCGSIIISLAVMHFINMYSIPLIGKSSLFHHH